MINERQNRAILHIPYIFLFLVIVVPDEFRDVYAERKKKHMKNSKYLFVADPKNNRFT